MTSAITTAGHSYFWQTIMDLTYICPLRGINLDSACWWWRPLIPHMYLVDFESRFDLTHVWSTVKHMFVLLIWPSLSTPMNVYTLCWPEIIQMENVNTVHPPHFIFTLKFKYNLYVAATTEFLQSGKSKRIYIWDSWKIKPLKIPQRD